MIAFRTALVTLAFIGTGCAAGALPPESPTIASDRGETTVYIVRHAEKATDDPDDPTLTAAGYARADSLASQLREAGINVIVTTQLRRSTLTARPLARLRGITPVVVPTGSPASAHVDSVVATVLRHPGAIILVVGHSNTIGPIARKLGGDALGEVCDHEYSNLIILTMPRAKPTQMLVERYGPPDPPADGSCVPMRRSR